MSFQGNSLFHRETKKKKKKKKKGKRNPKGDKIFAIHILRFCLIKIDFELLHRRRLMSKYNFVIYHVTKDEHLRQESTVSIHYANKSMQWAPS